MAGETWWLDEVRHEWAGHTWQALEANCRDKLLAEARIWADSPAGVLYVHARSIRDAFGFTVAVSQRAGQALCRNRPEYVEPLVVGLLDELSVPEDPDPEYTERARRQQPVWSAADTQTTFVHDYSRRLSEAPLALLRLSPAGDPYGVLDLIADHRRNWGLPTLVASIVPPSQVTPIYGGRIGWRLGFAEADGSPIGMATADASVLDLDRPPY
jgi:hypothetical protein